MFKRITPLTWITTAISGFYFVNRNPSLEGLLTGIGAGVIIGLINMGIHEIWYKARRKKQ